MSTPYAVAAADITPPMTPERTRQIAATFDLRALPADFSGQPVPGLRRAASGRTGAAHARRQLVSDAPRRPGGRLPRRSRVQLSDKQVEFAPKYGADSPLYEHHTTSLVFNDPPLHTRVRKLIMGALTRRAIAAMEPGLVALVDSLLDAIEARGGGDLIEDFASPFPSRSSATCWACRMPTAGRCAAGRWPCWARWSRCSPPQQEALGNQSVRDMLAYLKDLVAERRRTPGDPEQDVLTRLIQGEDSGERLTEVELLQNCIFMLNAGHETTTNLIGNALLTLQEFPDARADLLARLAATTGDAAALEPLMTLAVDEFLRFESSNQLGNRRALRRHAGGWRGPARRRAGDAVHRRRQPRPGQLRRARNVLDLQREGNRHLAFGFGIHQCAGLSLARLEGRIAIGRFLQRFPGYRLTQPPVRGGRARFRGFLSAPFVVA
jgi:cytochrome P450